MTFGYEGSTSIPSAGHVMNLGSNEISLFVNDYDSITVPYMGLDSNVYELPPNTAAYWFNGALIMFDGAEYNSLDLTETTVNGTIGTSEGNLGRIGFNAATSMTNVHFIIDDIVVNELPPTLDGASFSDWMNLYTNATSELEMTDDPDGDGYQNLMEYALGSNPVEPAHTIELFSESDGGSNWLYQVYNRRTDAAVRGLTYTALSGNELVFVGTTNVLSDYGVSAGSLGFESVTNRIPTDVDNQGFITLEAELTE